VPLSTALPRLRSRVIRRCPALEEAGPLGEVGARLERRDEARISEGIAEPSASSITIRFAGHRSEAGAEGVSLAAAGLDHHPDVGIGGAGGFDRVVLRVAVDEDSPRADPRQFAQNLADVLALVPSPARRH